jgi:hypothetical protein
MRQNTKKRIFRGDLSNQSTNQQCKNITFVTSGIPEPIFSQQTVSAMCRQPSLVTGSPLRCNRLQPVPVRPKLTPPQEEGK